MMIMMIMMMMIIIIITITIIIIIISRHKQLLDGLNEKRSYCKLKEEALDRSVWRPRFGIGYGPVVRQTAE